jgi:hypothetical protein
MPRRKLADPTGPYAIPLEEWRWRVPASFAAAFEWDYQEVRPTLTALYDKGKQLQWDGANRIDWTLDLDPENPAGMPDESVAIFGSDVWRRLGHDERTRVRHHLQAWQMSQFLHGEQGALVCTAKIVQQVPQVDAKFYAATQVMDEARHVEVFSRLLHEKYELAYPMTPALRTLIGQIVRDARWDITYLGMQVLIEGLALAAFAQVRDQAANRLAASVVAYVMQDEARHVAFGRLALRDFYPELTQRERDEREEFVVEACYAMRDRFLAEEVWSTLGLPVAECVAWNDASQTMRAFRTRLFTRIVPTIKAIGLFGPRVQRAYQDMGILDFADVDTEALAREDERLALAMETSH